MKVPTLITEFIINGLNNLANNVKFVQISSTSVYGSTESSAVIENSPLNPQSPYSEGKAIADEFLSKNCDLDWSIIRATSVYSNDLQTRVLGLIRKSITLGQETMLFGSGNEVRDFIHSNDFGSALSQIVSTNNTKKETYIIGYGRSISISDVTRIAISSRERKGKFTPQIIFNNTIRQGDPKFMRVNISKISNMGFRPMISPEKGISEYFGLEI